MPKRSDIEAEVVVGENGEVQILFRLNTNDPRQQLIFDTYKTKSRFRRGADWIKGCLYERTTGLSWLTNEPLGGEGIGPVRETEVRVPQRARVARAESDSIDLDEEALRQEVLDDEKRGNYWFDDANGGPE